MRRTGGLDVLRLRDFRLVFGAALVSLLGDGVAPLALTFAVLDLTGSATDLGAVFAARTAGLVGSLLIGGVVADRFPRRAVMIGADGLRLVAQGAVGVLLLTGHATVAEIAVSQAVVGAATGFFNPASSGLIPAVSGNWLQQANSLRGIASAAGNIAGPAIAGVLVATTTPGTALVVDAASYGVSALLLARVGHVPVTRGAAQSFLTELREGFAEVRSRTWLWSTLVALSLVNAVSVGFVVLGAVIVKGHLGGPGAWALILAAQGAGALVGGAALLRVTPRRPLLVATLIGLIPVVPTFLIAIPAPLAVIAVAALMGGIGNMVFNTLWETTLQQHIPEAARSRVSSYDWFGSLALQTLGFALIGPLAAAVGTSTALYLCGGVELAAVSALLVLREIRSLPARPIPAAGVLDHQ
jgi:MFS family permease